MSCSLSANAAYLCVHLVRLVSRFGERAENSAGAALESSDQTAREVVADLWIDLNAIEYSMEET